MRRGNASRWGWAENVGQPDAALTTVKKLAQSPSPDCAIKRSKRPVEVGEDRIGSFASTLLLVKSTYDGPRFGVCSKLLNVQKPLLPRPQ
jgi:hypothetical protein